MHGLHCRAASPIANRLAMPSGHSWRPKRDAAAVRGGDAEDANDEDPLDEGHRVVGDRDTTSWAEQDVPNGVDAGVASHVGPMWALTGATRCPDRQ